MNLLRRAARALWREAIARPLPHGLLGFGYMRRHPGPVVALHRALWLDALPGWPRWLVGLVEANLWLRWTMFGAWRATWRAVRRHGPAVHAAEGLSLTRQAWRVLGLAVRWCVPPAQAYQFALYRAPARADAETALNYVYNIEIAAWHRRANAKDVCREEAIALLRDKSALARRLATAGIPVVDTLAIARAGAPEDLGDWLDAHPCIIDVAKSGLFFKLREGMGASHAFAAWRRGDRWEARALHGATAHGREGLQSLWQALCVHGEVLVQPRLAAHPRLAELADIDDPVTARIITRRTGGTVTIEAAMLEVPLGRDGQHAFWPIGPENGEVHLRGWDGRPANPASTSIRAPEHRLVVPDWPRLQLESRRAHDLVGTLAWIAWDWIVTADGPQLLEGNSGWSATSPQRLFGPLTRFGG